jgi:hypothetical protein
MGLRNSPLLGLGGSGRQDTLRPRQMKHGAAQCTAATIPTPPKPVCVAANRRPLASGWLTGCAAALLFAQWPFGSWHTRPAHLTMMMMMESRGGAAKTTLLLGRGTPAGPALMLGRASTMSCETRHLFCGPVIAANSGDRRSCDGWFVPRGVGLLKSHFTVLSFLALWTDGIDT